MRRLVILAFIPFLSFWMIATGGGAGASPSLSGAWLFGNTRPEPKESVVSIPQRCWEGGVDFTLSEKGGTLTGTARWIQAASGVARPSRDETEALTGRRDGNHVVLTGKHTVVTAAPPYPTPD
ncbi:MAG TPA: hypothetical protein VKZ18_16620, partial [Polyangia bacterium]|nr:hypothetical protein [Polyangia bacterium]